MRLCVLVARITSNANPNATATDFFPADQVEQTPTASFEMRSVVSDVSVLSLVSDVTVPQLTLASTADFNQARVVRKVDNAVQRIAWFVLSTLYHWITIYLADRVIQPSNNWGQVEEYESDSDDSDNDVDIESEELVIGKPIMTRSGRQVKVWTRFDV